EDMRSNRTVGIEDRDRTLEDGLKTPPHVEPLRLAADEDRERLKLARRLARGLGCRGPRALRGGGGLAGWCERIELRLQLGIGGVPLRLQLGEFPGGLRRGVLGPRFRLVR